MGWGRKLRCIIRGGLGAEPAGLPGAAAARPGVPRRCIWHGLSPRARAPTAHDHHCKRSAKHPATCAAAQRCAATGERRRGGRSRPWLGAPRRATGAHTPAPRPAVTPALPTLGQQPEGGGTSRRRSSSAHAAPSRRAAATQPAAGGSWRRQKGEGGGARAAPGSSGHCAAVRHRRQVQALVPLLLDGLCTPWARARAGHGQALTAAASRSQPSQSTASSRGRQRAPPPSPPPNRLPPAPT